MNFHIRSATKSDAASIQSIAVKTWNHTHVKNIGQEQVDYMLSRIYSVECLQKQMDDGEKFLLIFISLPRNVKPAKIKNERPVGYISYTKKHEANKNDEKYFIEKLYIDPDYHSQGLGKALLDESISQIKDLGGNVIELHVNEHNEKAILFYEKYGFKNIKLDHYPFEKYIIHDYLMEMEL